jgi:DNA primase
MIIDINKLENWILLNFHSYKKYKGNYLVNSPFKPDKKFKLSISPSKKCYHCWKSDESGPIWKLVQIINKCSKQESIDLVYKTKINTIEDFETKIELLKKYKIEKENKTIKKHIELPYSFQPITIESKNKFNLKALKYCIKRKIDPMKWKIGYCDKGTYCGRIIIPFYSNNELLYWTARTFLNHEPKYLNPPINEFNSIKKEEIMFTGNIKKYDEIIVVEGILDAISLIDIGINSCSIQGKSLSDYHIEYLRQFKNVIIGFDNDNSGKEAAFNAINILNSNGIKCIYIKPKNNYKDWNQYYIENGKEDVLNYILESKNNQNNIFLDQIKLKIFKNN